MSTRKVNPDTNPEIFRKYDKTAKPIGYYPKIDRRIDYFQTEKQFNGMYAEDLDSFKKSNTEGRTFHRRNASTAELPKRPTSNALSNTCPSLMKSTSSSEYFYADKLKKGFQKYSGDDFKQAFVEVCRIQRTDTIGLQDIEGVVRATLGRDCPIWVIEKFVKLSESVSSYKRITWSNFRGVASRALTAAQIDCSTRKDKLPWLQWKPSADPTLAMAMDSGSTCYQDDFVPPATISCWAPGRSSTTRPLFIGSAKGTAHIPGFSAHIPVNLRNPKKYTYCMSEEPREVEHNLRLGRRTIGHDLCLRRRTELSICGQTGETFRSNCSKRLPFPSLSLWSCLENYVTRDLFVEVARGTLRSAQPDFLSFHWPPSLPNFSVPNTFFSSYSYLAPLSTQSTGKPETPTQQTTPLYDNFRVSADSPTSRIDIGVSFKVDDEIVEREAFIPISS
eukprot:gene3743-7431_t